MGAWIAKLMFYVQTYKALADKLGPLVKELLKLLKRAK
jgi:hypothetical protein